MNIYSNILANQNNFKFAFWDPNTDIHEKDFLFNICIEQLRNDLHDNNIKYHTVKRDKVVSIYEKMQGIYRISYYKYLDIIDLGNDEYHIRLRTGGKQSLDKLYNYHDFRDKLIGYCELMGKKLSSYDGVNSQTIRSKVNPAMYLKGKIGNNYKNIIKIECNELGKARLMAANRTNIIIISSRRSEEFENIICELCRDNVFFVDLFPTERITNPNKDKGIYITGLKHQRVNRESVVFIFSKLSSALAFIRRKKGGNFLILTDRFSQVFNTSIWQDMALTKGYNILYIGKVNDIKYFHEKNDTIYGEGNLFSNLIINHNMPNIKIFKNIITKINNQEIDSMVESVKIRKKEVRDIFPAAAKYCDNLLHLIYRCITPSHEDYDRIKDYCRKLNIDISESFIDEVYVNKLKLKCIENIILSTRSKVYLVDDYNTINSDILSKYDNIEILSMKHVVDVVKDSIIIIPYITPWSIMNILFPYLLYGRIDVQKIQIISYSHEYKILMYLYKRFANRIKPLIENAKDYTKLEEVTLIEDSLDDTYDYDDIGITYDYRKIASRYYEDNNKISESNTVKVKTLGMVDQDNEYIAFITPNFKPYLLDNDSIKKVDFEFIGYGDTLVFFGGNGERGILETYKEFFFKKDDMHIENVNAWKNYLKEFLHYDSENIDKKRLKLFIREINRNGLNRSENDVLRWIDNETIGTMNPKNDFKVIAKVIGKTEFIENVEDIAESCRYLQNKCKIVGKILKKIAIRDIADVNKDLKIDGDELQIKEQIENIIEKIKLLDVNYIDDSDEKYVSRSIANILIEVSDAKVNPTLFD